MSIDITTIGVGVDTSKLKAGTRELDSFGKSADTASRKADGLTKNTDSLAKSSYTAAVGLGRLAGALVSVAAVGSLARTVDEYTKFNAQLKLATRSQEEYAKAFADVERISKTAQASISSIGVLYARLNNSLRALGIGQEQVGRITETVGLALKVSGATAAETSSAMLQLSQAFGSGVLRGEEFNAVNEAAPALMRALADSIGVPIGALRQMASDGLITSEVLAKAFGNEGLLNTFREQAVQVNTISGAFQVLKNNIMLSVGEMNNATGAGAKFAKTILEFTESGAVRAFFQGLALSLAYIGYAFNAITTTASGLAIIMAKIVALDFKGAIDIGDALKDSARKAREELDKVTKAIMSPVKESPIVKETESISKNTASATVHTKNLTEARKALIDQDAKHQKTVEALFSIRREYEDQATAMYNKLANISEDNDKKEYERKVKQVELLQDIANKNYKQAQDQFLEGQREQVREFENTVDGINQVFREGFANMVNGGKGSWKAFTTSLFTTFKTAVADKIYKLFAEPFVVKILAGISGASISGSASASGGLINNILPGGGAGGGMGGLGDLFSLGKSLFSPGGFQGALVSSIEGLGVTLSNGLGGLGDTIGGFLGANAGMIADVLPFAGAALQLLSGNAKGAAFTAAGAAIGSLVPVIGTALGGVIGSVIGSFFGGSTPKRNWAQVRGSVVDGKFVKADNFAKRDGGSVLAPLTKLSEAFSMQLDGFLKSMGSTDFIRTVAAFSTRPGKDTKADFGGTINGKKFGIFGKEYDGEDAKAFEKFINVALGPAMVSAIKKSSLSDDIKNLFTGFRKKEEVLALMNATISLNDAQKELADRFGITVNQSAQAAKATGLTGQALIDYVNKLTGAASAFTKIGDALIKVRTGLEKQFGGTLPSDLKAFDNALKGIDKTTAAGIESFNALFAIREQFTQFTASIDGLKGNVRSALYSMVSDGEKQAMLNADLAKLFGDLGRDVPGSIQELIALGKSIDYTTAEGLNLAAVFPTLVNAFNQTQEAVDGLINSLRDTSSFKTLLDYQRYSGIQRNYGTSFANNFVDNLPSYDVGTNYVPNDGIAMIHQGERIIPAAQNQAMAQDSAQLVSEIRTLNAKVDRLVYSMDKTASSTKRTADILVNVTPNGDAIQTEAAA